MDAQHLIDALFAICGALAGVVLKTMWATLQQLRLDMAELAKSIGRDYVRRDDYRDDISEIKGLLTRIFDKLDEKADKP